MNPPSEDSNYFTPEQLDKLYVAGCAAIERYEGKEHKTCDLVTNCEDDFCNTFINTVIDDFLEKRPEIPAIAARLHISIDVQEFIKHPLGKAMLHAAGHYFVSMGVGLAISEEIR